jgi:hypothetical protein
MHFTALTSAHDLSPSWPIRWEQARGTSLETAALLSIAAEAEQAGDSDVYCAAHDAAHADDADDRAGFIADLEELFAWYDAQERVDQWGLDPDFLRDERAEQQSVLGMAA